MPGEFTVHACMWIIDDLGITCSLIAKVHSFIMYNHNIACRMYPDGMVLKQLEEQHSDIIASTWPHSDNLPAKQSYFKTLIENYHSVGLFSQDKPDESIGWCVQYPYGHPGHLFVVEEHRRREFASLLLEHMCRCIRADGLTPQITTEVQNECGNKLMKRFSFVEHTKFRYVRHLC